MSRPTFKKGDRIRIPDGRLATCGPDTDPDDSKLWAYVDGEDDGDWFWVTDVKPVGGDPE